MLSAFSVGGPTSPGLAAVSVGGAAGVDVSDDDVLPLVWARFDYSQGQPREAKGQTPEAPKDKGDTFSGCFDTMQDLSAMFP